MFAVPYSPREEAEVFPLVVFTANDTCLVFDSADSTPREFALDEKRKRELDETELRLASTGIVHDDFEDHWRDGTPTSLFALPFSYRNGTGIDMFIRDVPDFIDEELIASYESEARAERAAQGSGGLPSVTTVRLDAIGMAMREHPEVLLPIYYKLSTMDLMERAE